MRPRRGAKWPPRATHMHVLRRTRESSSRRLTQGDLARMLGSSQSRVAKLEAGAAGVSLDLMFRALLAIGATTDDIAREIRAKKRTAA